MKKSILAASLTILLTAGGSTAGAQERDDLFRYDRSAGLALEEAGVEKRGNVDVHDVSFVTGPGGERTHAYLVRPAGEGPFGGALWVHWLGEPATTNRKEFLDEAVSLAPSGLVSVLVDAMWAAPHWYRDRVPERDFEESIRQVVALRRALDLLQGQKGVDGARLGFVGHDYGGMYGMLLGGADGRLKTYVYVATAPSLSDWAFFGRQPASKADYLRKNASLELTDALRQTRNASTLFQFASRDAYVSGADTSVLLDAATAPKERRVYDSDHSVDAPEAARDRAAWLRRELKLEGQH